MNDSICAISTPPGLGAIALIRASGDDVFTLSSPLFSPDFHLDALQPHCATLTTIYDGSNILDQVVLIKYAAPHSYTGENSVEISCHGSLYIQKRILELLIDNGCRMANAGEFTQRAFLNGKLDLPQAEAIADLIDSQTEITHRLAVNQLKGDFSNKILEMRTQFVQLASLMELELDFSEEDVEFANRDDLTTLLHNLKTETQRLIHAFKIGNVLKTGIPVTIVGKPNVGKSTLLNTLIKQDRAIVSHIPGTTRDTIEDTFTLNGTLFRFIDTAGIHESEDELENIGIKRTFKAVKEASIILYMIDLTTTSLEDAIREVDEFKQHVSMTHKDFIILANKIDQLETLPPHYQQWHNKGIVFISAKRRVNIEDIENRLTQFVEAHQIQDVSLLTNERHYGLLKNILASLKRIQTGLDEQIPTDLIAVDVRAALYDLGCLTGTISTDEILDNIFSKFCIGK